MSYPTHLRHSTIFSLATVLIAAAGSHAQPVVQVIARLPGGTYIFPDSISDNGLVVVGDADIAGGSNRAFRWTSTTGTQNLGVAPGYSYSSANACSGDAMTVVGVSGTGYDIAAKWTQSAGMTSLGSLASGQPSFAWDTSDNASVIVGFGYLGSGLERGWKWTGATGMQAFSTLVLDTNHSVALRTESSGAYTVGYCYNNAPALIMPTGCVWQPDGSVVTMPKLPNLEICVPSDIADGGLRAFGYCADRDYVSMVPFMWTASSNTTTELSLPPGLLRGTVASCTSDGAMATGYALDATDLAVGCIWRDAQPVQTIGAYLSSLGVNTTGWSFGSCSVNDAGSALTGTGIYNGATTAWYVYLGPGCTTAPLITTHPTSVTVNESSPASFALVATGGALSYQWYKGTSLLSGQVLSTLNFPSVVQADAGTYFCIVSSACGSATSSDAVLTVVTTCPLPEVLLQPVDTQGCAGSTITLATDAVNGDPVEYEWRHDGNDIPGANSSTLTLANVSPDDAGTYVCRVINDCGNVFTDEVQITVNAQCCDSIDFNNDTSLFDPQDIDAFLSVYSEGPCVPDLATCNDIDFNNDESLFDPCDIDSFLLQFSEGPCTGCGM